MIDAKWIALFVLLKEFAILYIIWCEDNIQMTAYDKSTLAKRREKARLAT